MSAHTPGPWHIEQNIRGGVNIRCSWGVIGTIFNGSSFVHSVPDRANEQSANANLIAAAPDLLEALKKFANLDRTVNSGLWEIRSEECEKARAAIAKALGGA